MMIPFPTVSILTASIFPLSRRPPKTHPWYPPLIWKVLAPSLLFACQLQGMQNLVLKTLSWRHAPARSSLRKIIRLFELWRERFPLLRCLCLKSVWGGSLCSSLLQKSLRCDNFFPPSSHCPAGKLLPLPLGNCASLLLACFRFRHYQTTL